MGHPTNRNKYKEPIEDILAVSIVGGIITLIEPTGLINYYRQRGIQRFTQAQIAFAINSGALDPDWANYPELPRYYHIYFEDEEIMGKAKATFSLD